MSPAALSPPEVEGANTKITIKDCPAIQLQLSNEAFGTQNRHVITSLLTKDKHGIGFHFSIKVLDVK